MHRIGKRRATPSLSGLLADQITWQAAVLESHEKQLRAVEIGGELGREFDPGAPNARLRVARSGRPVGGPSAREVENGGRGGTLPCWLYFPI